ncbi:hypothetical protein SLA2020_102900 [Shorea laevis]
MKDTIVLYPSPGRSHLVSVVELAKLILSHHPSFSVTIIITDAPFETGSTASYIASVSAETPSFTFHHLPTIPIHNTSSSILDIKTLSFEFHTLINHHFHDALLSISQSSNLKALIMDFFCNYSFEVSTSLGIPTYYFITGGLTGLAAFLYLPTLHKNFTKSFKELDEILYIPGIPPIPAKNMPVPMLDRSLKIYKYFLETAIQMTKSAGIIVNAIETLEQKALKAIQNGECTPDHPAPPIYCIGPLVPTDVSESGGANISKHESLTWLDSQPSRSVVFLTFGSIGRFSAKQLKEIAIGLENSSVRFLWVVRAPPPDESEKTTTAAAVEPSLDLLLPDGFMERTKERGFVVKGWAPQVEVLNHDSVGGFVTTCGWNSMFESLRAGVPMLGWTIYAEQNINQLAIVEELKVGLALRKREDGSVSAAELEKGVIELMDSESDRGKELRGRVASMREELLAALSDGGPSRAALARLAETIQCNGVIS